MTLDLSNGVTMKLVRIRPGKFMMGSAESDHRLSANECPQHEVTISKVFYLGVTGVTQAEYEAGIGKKPGDGKGMAHSALRVSWNDATEFCRKVSERTHQIVRLPTEAEWEYACRAGSKTRFCFGDADKDFGEYAWFDGNSGGTPRPVGQKRPNGWGLFDMHGNVMEWCADWYGDYSKEAQKDPQGPASGSKRVVRGSPQWGTIVWTGSALRNGRDPAAGQPDIGFRVVVSAAGLGLK